MKALNPLMYKCTSEGFVAGNNLPLGYLISIFHYYFAFLSFRYGSFDSSPFCFDLMCLMFDVMFITVVSDDEEGMRDEGKL